jgi:hypothetical protein
MKGVTAEILRPAHGQDCTNGGASSRATHCLIVGPDVPEVFEAREGEPVFVIRRRGDYVYAVPLATEETAGYHWMAGGNFLYCCDSRFRQQVNAYPVSIHDRHETSA